MEITRTILVLLAAICSANAFSKYGRTCKDIGCLPSETCIMAEDSCSYYQEKNKECGAYPTCKKGASVNHSPGASAGSDHSRNNPYNNNNNNNYNNNQYGQGNGYGGQSIDPNQIFGSPNGRPSQSNQPWKDLPIFAPNPTSGHGKQPQQSSGGIFSQAPNYPSNGNSYPNGFAPNGFPPQIPFAFGVPPPNSAHNIYPRPTTHQPSLLDQFLYNKQGGRRNAASTMHANWQQSTYIIIFSIFNVLAGFILTARNYH